MTTDEQNIYDDRKTKLQANLAHIPQREMFIGNGEIYKEQIEKGLEKIDAFIADNENPPVAEIFKCLGYLEEYLVVIEKQTRL